MSKNRERLFKAPRELYGQRFKMPPHAVGGQRDFQSRGEGSSPSGGTICDSLSEPAPLSANRLGYRTLTPEMSGSTPTRGTTLEAIELIGAYFYNQLEYNERHEEYYIKIPAPDARQIRDYIRKLLYVLHNHSHDHDGDIIHG